MTYQDSFHEVAFNISFWTRNISSARILFWRGVCFNSTWCMQNLSWMQFTPSSNPNYASVDTKVGEAIPSMEDKNCDGMSPDHSSG